MTLIWAGAVALLGIILHVGKPLVSAKIAAECRLCWQGPVNYTFRVEPKQDVMFPGNAHLFEFESRAYALQFTAAHEAEGEA